jgi:hypothetical protein
MPCRHYINQPCLFHLVREIAGCYMLVRIYHDNQLVPRITSLAEFSFETYHVSFVQIRLVCVGHPMSHGQWL